MAVKRKQPSRKRSKKVASPSGKSRRNSGAKKGKPSAPDLRRPNLTPPDLPPVSVPPPGPLDALRTLGFGSIRALQEFGPYKDARLLVAAARNDIDAPNLDAMLMPEFAKLPFKSAPTWPLESLRGLSEVHRRVLATAGVRSVADLSEVGRYAEQAIATGREDNGFYELPSAPAELLPTMVGAVVSRKRYSSFVREVDLRELRVYVKDPSCLEPLPLSRLSRKAKEDRYLVSIFTEVKCPVYALGYVAEFQQDWINLGTYLGEVVNSLSLIPGESRNIAFVNWDRQQRIDRREDTEIDENLRHRAIHDRALEEVTGAVAREHQMGGTEIEAATGASFVGAGALVGAASLGAAGAVVGSIIEPGGGTLVGAFAGGAAGAAVGGAAGAAAFGLVQSGAQVLGRIHAATEGDRDVVGELFQQITLSTQQNSSLERSVRSTVVLLGQEAEQIEATTSNVTNYNHMHTLNVVYYEILQQYLVAIRLRRAEPLLYLPYTSMDFSDLAFVRDYWDAVREHVSDGLRVLGDAYFVTEGKPQAPDFVPEPTPPTLDPPSLDTLLIKVVFNDHFFSNVGLDVDIRRGEFRTGSVGPPFTINDEDNLDGYNKGLMFQFPSIADATRITAVVLSIDQPDGWIGSDVQFSISVQTGLLSGHGTANLSGQVIKENGHISKQEVHSGTISFDFQWRPAEAFLEASEAEMNVYLAGREDYEEKLRLREEAQGESFLGRKWLIGKKIKKELDKPEGISHAKMV